MTGSAALFYLTNSEYRSEQSVKLRRQVIQVVLNGMESYQEVTVSPSPLHALAQPPPFLLALDPGLAMSRQRHACSPAPSAGSGPSPCPTASLPDSGTRHSDPRNLASPWPAAPSPRDPVVLPLGLCPC